MPHDILVVDADTMTVQDLIDGLEEAEGILSDEIQEIMEDPENDSVDWESDETVATRGLNERIWDLQSAQDRVDEAFELLRQFIEEQRETGGAVPHVPVRTRV